MLILSRKLNESIVIDGQIIVKILRIDRDTVKLGIQAPAQLPVHRQEIHEAIVRNGQGGGTAATPAATRSSASAPAMTGVPE
ncbi:MAG: carbon storage regulator CsrA [bacterium]|nr:carbon storage regulator CsrA [bacterium]